MMKSSISGIQTFNFEQDLVFDAYIQFKEYVGFVKAMNALKGMKLLFKDRYEDKAWVANIKVSHRQCICSFNSIETLVRKYPSSSSIRTSLDV